MEAQQRDTIHKRIAVVLFAFLFVYLCLRVFLLETLHDEVATYMFYFYQGDFWGSTTQWDANNHLLNSALGHVLYKLFGDHFGILRLPNLIAFVLYFLASYRLTKAFETPWLKTTALLALNTIPFVMEYFGNARGYGLSMGFFLWALVHGMAHLKTYSLRSLFLSYFFLIIAISANLTLINSAGFLGLIFFLYPLMNKQESRVAWKEIILHIGFALALLPLVQYGLMLSKAGALYYGSLDGLWDVTGKTLSRYVLFYDGDWLLFAWISIFALLLVAILVHLRKSALREWLQAPALVYSILFFGNLIMALILAKGFEINYPEDRTAMYLIPLFILLLCHVLEVFRPLRYIQWIFLYFPITLAAHLSLDTSVFSPDDRMNDDFYATVKSHILPENTVMIYHIMNWNWPYHESHNTEKASVAQFDNPNSTLPDILITKTTVLTNPAIVKLYDTIAYHPASTYIAFKRKVPLLRVPLDSIGPIHEKGNLEYAGLEPLILERSTGKNMLVSVSGHLKTLAPHNKIQLVVETQNAEGTNVRYYYYSFETTYQSQLIDADFTHHFMLEKVLPEEKQIKVYLWNRALHYLDVKGFECRTFELKSPENGTR